MGWVGQHPNVQRGMPLWTLDEHNFSEYPGPARSRSAGPLIGLRSVAESPAFAAGLDDLAMVRGSVEQGRRHLRVTENARPFPESEVRHHHDRRALVESADKMEQQQPAAQIEG